MCHMGRTSNNRIVPRTTRKESNIQKLNSSKVRTVLIQYCGFSSPFYTLGRVGIEWKSDKIIIIQSVSFSHHQLVISKAPTPPKNLPTPISMLHLWKLTAQPMPSTGLHKGLKYFLEKPPNFLTCSCGFLHCNNLFQFTFQLFQISLAYSHEQKHVLLLRKSTFTKMLENILFQ